MYVKREVISRKLEFKAYDFIVSGEPKSLIKFCLDPISAHEILWVIKLKNKDELIVLHKISEPISDGSFIQFDADMMATASHTILSGVLAQIPTMPRKSKKRDELANEILYDSRQYVTENAQVLKNKSVVISINIRVGSLVFMEKEDLRWMHEHGLDYLERVRLSDDDDEEEEEQDSSESDTDTPTCAICLEEYFAGSTVIFTPCIHDFHESCIIEWLENKDTCPLCRYHISLSHFQQIFYAEPETDSDS